MPIISDSSIQEYLEKWENDLLVESSKTKFSTETLNIFLKGLHDIVSPSLMTIMLHKHNVYDELEGILPVQNHPDDWLKALENEISTTRAYPSIFDLQRDDLQVLMLSESRITNSKELRKPKRNLQTGWFICLKDSDRKIIATFIFFFENVRHASEMEKHFLKRCSLFLSILIQQQNLQDRILFDRQTFSLISSSTNDAIWDWDVRSNRLWWSEGFESLFGHKRSELSEYIESWTKYIHPEDHDPVTNSLDQAIEAGHDKWSHEYRFMNSEGMYLSVIDQGYIVRNQKGEPVRVVGGMRDITQQKHHQEMLSEQAALLNLARDAIIVRSLDHKILYWNKGAEKLYGYSADEALKKEIHKLLFRDPTDFFYATERTITDGEWEGQLQQLTKDSKIVHIKGSWTLVKDEQGLPKSILVINTDITDQVNVRHQLMRAQRFESINTLTSGLAHNLNNCLTPIILSLQKLKKNNELEKYAHTFSIMEKSAWRGTDLIKQLMKHSQADNLSIEVFSPLNLITEVVQLALETFPKRISLSYTVDPDIKNIKGDPGQLHQVLLNLLINARDAISGNGEIILKAENVQLKSRMPGLQSACGEFIKISVKDSGHGMDDKTIQQIFDPFFTTKDTNEGTGLGLSTCHTIVKNHHGFFRVISQPGAGATFELYLPFKEDLCDYEPQK